MGVTAAILGASAIMAAATGAQSAVQHHEAKKARSAQEEAQMRAEATQREANRNAEKKRLEGLASNKTIADYGNIWGSGESKMADAARKFSAGAGSFSDDEETNPFYSRGLF